MDLCRALLRLIIVPLLIVFTGASGLLAQGQILHSPARNYIPGQEIELEAVVEGTAANVEEVRLLYKPANQSGFAETTMEFRYGYYYGTIPSEFATEAGIKYAIIAELVDGQLIAFPEENPYDNPVFIPAAGQSQSQSSQPQRQQTETTRERVYSDDYSTQSEELILSPTPNSSVPQNEVLIAVTLYTIPDVDPESIRLLVDGTNVTKQAEISPELVTYRNTQMRQGLHTVRMQFKDVAGRTFEPLSWQFRVTGAEEGQRAELDMRGRMYVESSRSEIRNRLENINKVNADIRGSYGFLNFNGNVYLTSKEDPSVQPRNRYRLGLNSSKLRLQFGDFYPRLSRLGMWGKRVRGVNTQLLLDYVNLHVVYGYSERAIQGTGVLDSSIAQIDTLQQNPLMADTTYDYYNDLRGYTFPRRVLAVRPSFGSGKHFQLGFSLISSRDDTTQINTGLDNVTASRAVWNGATPKDNIVVGSDLLIAFDRQRFVWESSASLSWQNDDIFGGALTAEDTLEFGSDFQIPVSDFPIDPSSIQNLFIINSHIQPFLPVPASVDSNFNLTLRPGDIQDYGSLAYQSKVSMNYFNNYLTMQYRRVGAAYNSFANPYIRKDVAGIEFSDRIRMFKNKVYLTLKYESLDEGLSREVQNRITSNNAGTGLSIYPGGDFPTINFNLNQYHRFNGLDERFTRIDTTIDASTSPPTAIYDTTYIDNRVDNTTMSNTITISQPINLFGINHELGLNYLRSFKEDNIVRSKDYPDITYSMNLISVSLQSRFDIPLMTRLSYSMNENETGPNLTRFQIISAGGQYRMFNRNLILNGQGRYTKSTGATEFVRTGFEGTIRYRFLEDHTLSTNIRVSRTDETISPTESSQYTNLIYRLRYSYQF
ncbi:MAG: hypothetical protein K9N46_13570 [Candidatus Marinimicrobia bacterium]|nr:hypothetical protein [Candidatus Neomarinimicrobiota bacterium]MCF7829806.1 hypothetical protein [Candidatus Neomarinimicrobiota bacterium]MCF7881761.1 hypothetical protein [Candidatus Neomarinimicrobiota bacterium]